MQNPDDWEQALRQGLRAVPVPEVSDDFDNRLLQSLHTPEPWWRSCIATLRPVAAAMCCSLVATLVVVNWTLSSPTALPMPLSPSPVETHTDLAAVDRVLNSPNLRADSLQRMSRNTPASSVLEHVEHGPPIIHHALRPTHSLFA